MNSIQYERSLNTPIPSVTHIPDTSSSAIRSASTASASLVSKISSWSWTNWAIVVLVLAFLGINVFSILGKGTERIAHIIKPIVDFFTRILGALGITALKTGEQTVVSSATGVNAVANTTANITTQAVDKITHSGTPINNTSVVAPNTNDLHVQGQMQSTGSQIDYGNSKSNQMTDVRNNTLQRALNDAESHMNEQNDLNANSDGIIPDDSYSAIQSGGKSGWCYIGEERGVRSCVEVGVNDICMSGDVFPTNDICVNPNLRM